MTLEVGDRATCGHELAGKLGLVALEPARGLLRQRQFPAKRLIVAFRFRRSFLEHLAFGARRVVPGANFGERVAQADIVGLLLLERTQRNADGLDKVAEGILDVVERGDPAIGVNQQIAQGLVALADAGTEIGKCRLVVLCGATRSLPRWRCGHRESCRRGWNTLAPEKTGDGTHGNPTPNDNR